MIQMNFHPRISHLLLALTVPLLTVFAVPAAVAPNHTQYPDSELLAALTLQDNPESPTNGIDCNNIFEQRAECWDILDMPGYLINWTDYHQDNCTLMEKAWVNCYVAIITDSPGIDCTVMNEGACNVAITFHQTDPRVYYALYNIYAINALFKDWATAVRNAATISLGDVGNMVQNINPPQPQGFNWYDLLNILGVAFAFAPGFAGVAAFVGHELGAAARSASAAAILNSAAQVPQVLKILFLKGSTTEIQINQMESELSTLIANMTDRLTNALANVTSDATTFINFASGGQYSTGLVNATELTSTMVTALNTYIISSCLAQNNIYSVVGRGTNVAQLVANSTKELTYNINCPGYDQFGVCDAWWYSNTTGDTYTLSSFQNSEKDYGDLLSGWFGNYTTPEALFEGSDICTASGGNGLGPTLANGSDDTINLACVSQITRRTWNMGCNNPTSMSTCEFLDGPSQPDFGQKGFECWERCSYSGPRIVPYGYLGPLVLNSERKVSVKGKDVYA